MFRYLISQVRHCATNDLCSLALVCGINILLCRTLLKNCQLGFLLEDLGGRATTTIVSDTESDKINSLPLDIHRK